MNYTQKQLDALRAALATGATRVQYDGKVVEYRSLDEIQRTIALIEADLGKARPSRFSLAGFRR